MSDWHAMSWRWRRNDCGNSPGSWHPSIPAATTPVLLLLQLPKIKLDPPLLPHQCHAKFPPRHPTYFTSPSPPNYSFHTDPAHEMFTLHPHSHSDHSPPLSDDDESRRSQSEEAHHFRFCAGQTPPINYIVTLHWWGGGKGGIYMRGPTFVAFTRHHFLKWCVLYTLLHAETNDGIALPGGEATRNCPQACLLQRSSM